MALHIHTSIRCRSRSPAVGEDLRDEEEKQQPRQRRASAAGIVPVAGAFLLSGD
jgi:hypothetical protein